MHDTDETTMTSFLLEGNSTSATCLFQYWWRGLSPYVSVVWQISFHCGNQSCHGCNILGRNLHLPDTVERKSVCGKMNVSFTLAITFAAIKDLQAGYLAVQGLLQHLCGVCLMAAAGLSWNIFWCNLKIHFFWFLLKSSVSRCKNYKKRH